jgi:GTP-binding protein
LPRLALRAAVQASTDDFERGRWLFAQACDFVAGADNVGALPPITLPEIAFAGRSNVGKSSLVNALTGRKTLARTSRTPGRTQQLNFFDLAGRLMLVDMPGYGYAAVGREKVDNWTTLVHAYLRGRSSLMRVLLLIDARHGLKPVDHATMDVFDRAAVSYGIVLTKSDQTKPADLARTIDETTRNLEKHPAALPEVHATSADDGVGVSELRSAIVTLMGERGYPVEPRQQPHGA